LREVVDNYVVLRVEAKIILTTRRIGQLSQYRANDKIKLVYTTGTDSVSYSIEVPDTISTVFCELAGQLD